MESAVDGWRRRSGEPWISGVSAADLQAEVSRQRARIASTPTPHCVDVPAAEPWRTVATVLAVLTFPEPVQAFLGEIPAAPDEPPPDRTHLMIATGGTSGLARWAVHTWETLATAAHGLRAALGGGPVHSVCFLPLHHVSGLMQVVRSFVSGGRLVLADGRALGAGEFPSIPDGAVTSIVPTQLVRLLERPDGATWLRRFRAVFLGGGPAWPELLDRARAERLPLAPCYGMTETAAQVTMMSPDVFLAGGEGAGGALPHATIAIVDETTGAVLAPGVQGRIHVRSESLCHGFLPNITPDRREFLTSDRGRLGVDGNLTVLGRSDAVIITGGEKVDPAEVEAVIRATGLVDDVAVLGVPDAKWGEAVVAVIAGAAKDRKRELAALVRSRLPPPKRPKRWVSVATLPRNHAGKLNRRALLAIAAGAI